MSEKALRNAIIRLAYTKAYLRKDLLPLVVAPNRQVKGGSARNFQPYKVRLNVKDLAIETYLALARARVNLPVRAGGEWIVWNVQEEGSPRDTIHLARELDTKGKNNFLTLYLKDWRVLLELGLVEILGSVPNPLAAKEEEEEEEEGVDLTTFNTDVAKLMRKLKGDIGVQSIRQNYRGTGGQKARRQINVRFEDGSQADVWLDQGFVRFGEIRAYLSGVGTSYPSPRKINYGKKTPAQVYSAIRKALQTWHRKAK